MKPADHSSSPDPDLIRLFVAPLENAGIGSYMVSGSVASIEYGEPRATLDIDLVLLLDRTTSQTLPDLFPAESFYLPPPEILEIEFKRQNRGHFNIIHHSSGLKADCYPSRNHPCLPWALANRRRIPLMGVDVWFAPPEYVILWKLDFYREGGGEKHIRDVRGILAVSGNELDKQFLNDAIPSLGLSESWAFCQKEQ
jgi:hypothetical protein